MRTFVRYAIYYAPPAGSLASFGAAWLGWDALTGREVEQPSVPGLDLVTLTEAPRKYGFHGTIKPPFRLVDGRNSHDLEVALSDLCKGASPFLLEGLRLTRVGRFLALTPVGDTAPLASLAAQVVTELDGFRARPSTAELDRRRLAGLTPRQDALLLRWGYPYVMEEFRFHLTLTGPLGGAVVAKAETVLQTRLGCLNLAPFPIDSLCLFGEGDDGHFRRIRRVFLGG